MVLGWTAWSTAYLTDRVTAARTRRMAKPGYWGGSSGLALWVWSLVRVEIVGLEFPMKWVFWLPCGARAPAWCKKGRVPPLGLFFGFAEAVGLAAVLIRLLSPWEPREYLVFFFVQVQVQVQFIVSTTINMVHARLLWQFLLLRTRQCETR